MKTKLFFLLGLLLYCVNGFSQNQKIWTLQQCIDYAYENNLQIRQQMLSSETTKINAAQTKAAMLPSLNGSATNVYNYGKTVDMYTNSFATERVRSNNFYLSSNVTIFNGFQKYNNMRANMLSYEASKWDLQKMKDDIALSIASAYLQILYSEEQVTTATSQSEITRQQIERTQKLVDAGKINKQSLLELEAQLATEELSLVNAQNQLELAYLNLAQMLDLSDTKDFKIEKPIIPVNPDETFKNLNPGVIFEKAVSSQPSIKSAELKLQSSTMSFNATRGMRSPTLSMQGSIGTGYSGASKQLSGFTLSGYDTIGFTSATFEPVVAPSFQYDYKNIPFKDQFNDNVNKSFGFYLSIPIFNGWQTKTAVSRSKISMMMAELNLATVRNQLNKDIQQAYADVKAAYNKYNATLKSVNALETSFNFINERYTLNMLTTIEFNDSKNKLDKSKSDLLQAKYEFVFRLKILDFYQGKQLTIN
ncbi:MAG: TolC family protein [Bacteroidota bacterium]